VQTWLISCSGKCRTRSICGKHLRSAINVD
jgi:hypothetical protein